MASSAAPAVSASPRDPDAADKRAVLASYTSMWVEQMKAYRKASPDSTKVDDYATLEALSAFERDLAHMKKNNTVIRGEVGHQPEVTALDVDAKLPTATVEDCIDLSKWKTLDTKTNKPIPLPTAPRARVNRQALVRQAMSQYPRDRSLRLGMPHWPHRWMYLLALQDPSGPPVRARAPGSFLVGRPDREADPGRPAG
ncbi:hypothetical protein ACIRD6_39320 [Streptomyces sp. NPDC102473]|uniref:hypothetical protein n=1 Tax=Streptomyces sp. NPDC102473 TaxID=3366180 RepID=UPI0037F6F5A8